MPLTLAHPAAVLALARKPFIMSALVVGSMAPDFAKFAMLSPRANFGHTWLGILWFCIPAGFFTLWVFHRVLKEPLSALLPISHQTRLSSLDRFSFGPVHRSVAIAVSLAIGAFTHLAWDSFTHEDGLGVLLLPVLNNTLMEAGGRELKLFKVLQHGSTLFGLSVLLICYFRWLKYAPARPLVAQPQITGRTKARLWFVFCVGALLAGALYGWFNARGLTGLVMIKIFAGRTAVGTIATFAALLLLFSLRQHWRKL